MNIRPIPAERPGCTLAYRVGACDVVFSAHAEQRCEQRGYDPRAVALHVVYHFPQGAGHGQEVRVRKLPGRIVGTNRRHKSGCAIAKRIGHRVVILTVLGQHQKPRTQRRH